MKDNWKVFKIEYVDKHGKTHGRALDFMGFKFYRNRTTLRRNIMLRASKKQKELKIKINLHCTTVGKCYRILDGLQQQTHMDFTKNI